MNFFITALPRSRTAWFANYFSTGDVFCYHEAMNNVTCKEDYWARMNCPASVHVGNSDCGLYMGGYTDGAPLVIIERDIDEVDDALIKQGFPGCRAMLEESLKALNEMTGLRVLFDTINERLEEIHQFCVTTPFDERRADQLINLKVELTEIIPDVKSARVWR